MSRLAGIAQILLLLCGCSLFRREKKEDYGYKPPTGTPHVTPKYGFTFYWNGSGGKYATPDQAATGIDDAFFRWLPLYEQKYGFALSREQRRAHLARIKIQLFTGDRVPGNSNAEERGIWWPVQQQIDTSMATPYHKDLWLLIYTEGLEQLIHEWMHVFGTGAHD